MAEEVVMEALKELREGWIELEREGGVAREVEGADFGDRRLNKRYGVVLGQMMKMPQSPFNQSSECLSQMHAAYRFVSNKKVSVEKLLAPHREQISKRAQGDEVVLAIQDSTIFDLSDHLSVEGLSPLNPGRIARALSVHSVLFVLPSGLPLGIGHVQSYSGKQSKDDRYREDKRIEEKTSGRWLTAVSKCQGLFENDTRVVWLSDRESDIYELLEHIAGVKHEFVIRARVNRGMEEGPHYDTGRALAAAPVVKRFAVEVHGNFKRKARTAEVELRYIKATISVPISRKQFTTSSSLTTSVVEVREVNAPENAQPVHWQLVTNLSVKTAKEAMGIVNLYKRRWAVEELFKILKSGCRAEKAQFQTVERLTKYAALSLIVAWRIYYLVHLNRVSPEAPAESVTTKAELATLQLLLDAKRKARNLRRTVIKTAHQVILQIASLGGHLNRKGDPSPGTLVIWRGTMALAVATMTFLAQASLRDGSVM